MTGDRRDNGISDEVGDNDVTRRAREALRRALNTPHKPQQPIKDNGKSPAKRGQVKRPGK